MLAIRILLLAAAPCFASSVTPMEKVITLIEDLQADVQNEGAAEAAAYDTFACFCKDNTGSKSDAITKGQDEIEGLSATIAETTAERESEETNLGNLKATKEQLSKELHEEEVRCAKAKAVYEAQNADLEKAIKGLEGAMTALDTAKPGAPASLLAISQSVESTLELAEVLDLVEAPKRLAVNAFLQQKVDPNDPEYKYHSQGILDTINKLLVDFRSTKADADSEYQKTETSCKQKKTSLAASIESTTDEITTSASKISQLKEATAAARTSLVEAEGMLKDDQEYLKDLTKRCEDRAKDFDQRSQLRADELTAISQALTVLKKEGGASDMDTAANKRALLIAKKVEVAPHAPSFLQEEEVRKRGLVVHKEGTFSMQMRQNKVADLLRSEGIRLKSTTLSTIAMKAASDPFAKVKQLIQDLVERLIAEATAEATKKGFCDTELGKANKDREFRQQDIKKLNVKIAALEVKEDELENEITELTEALTQLQESLATAEATRKTEKATNIQTLKDSKQGLSAIKEAIKILKTFYKQAAKATVLVQASPVDEDTSGPGFSGAYKGGQKKSVGIIGLLEVIESDFDRTLRTTAASEKKAAADFVNFDRTSRSDIAGKTTKKELDTEDLATTKNGIAQGLADMQSEQNLLDGALKTIEALKPTCIDTTMTYAERVQKREEEMTALKKALCILDPNGVEADCSP